MIRYASNLEICQIMLETSRFNIQTSVFFFSIKYGFKEKTFHFQLSVIFTIKVITLFKIFNPWCRRTLIFSKYLILDVAERWYFQRNWVFVTNSDFLWLQSNVIELRYFKLWILLDEIILVWNIKGVRPQVANMEGGLEI